MSGARPGQAEAVQGTENSHLKWPDCTPVTRDFPASPNLFPLNSELTDNLNFLLVLETFIFTSSSFQLLLIKHSLQIVCFQSEQWLTICTAEKGRNSFSPQ